MFTGVQGTAAMENVLLAAVVSQLLLSVQFASSSASSYFICSLWLLPLPLIGGAAPPTPTPSLHRKLSVHLAEEVPPPRILVSSLDSEILSVRLHQGSTLMLGGGFWFTESSAHDGGLLRFSLGKVEASDSGF